MGNWFGHSLIRGDPLGYEAEDKTNARSHNRHTEDRINNSSTLRPSGNQDIWRGWGI